MNLRTLLTAVLVMGLLTACKQNNVRISYENETRSLIHTDKALLLLPVQEDANEVQVRHEPAAEGEAWMDVRLAVDRVDYFVPFEAGGDVRIKGLARNAVAWKEIKGADHFDTANTEVFRPAYHFTPAYGWMNDPNGLFFKDGVYHLYYQYNPYGSMWGNMHWGHAVSKDLIHWEHQPIALERDADGHIFSGSVVVDKENTAGYGDGAVIAFYTCASDRQIQHMAYSTDDGRTFTKYEGNPVLEPFDGLKDFRDPKVFRYEDHWVMIVSADKEMRFYRSSNLKEWTYMSAFGEGYGVQPRQFECPDFFPLTADGVTKWVMIVNVNPGCYFGGSATQYFVGDFDGTRFVCDSKPETVKWLDWGKDHYAAVTFHGTPGEVIAVPWMSNWQYANIVPTKQFRSADGLPRTLRLFKDGNEYYVAADPVAARKVLRKQETAYPDQTLRSGEDFHFAIPQLAEIEMTLDSNAEAVVDLTLSNGAGESVLLQLDRAAGRLSFDRSASGAMTDNKDYAVTTWAPLEFLGQGPVSLDIFIDRCSIEIFANGGRIAMTNLVFPTEPLSSADIKVVAGSTQVTGIKGIELNEARPR
ncbi:MAG: GH32 C-terminal domain-containing protein [Bacteroidales bacterium]|nr:GH32 C-terminal domain-containing protein [Bacteroidales bacterium]